MIELSKSFTFDAAHTLQRSVNVEPSRRIHGHSYRAEVAIRGIPAPETGMLIDLSIFEAALEDARDGLDHRFLDEINDLGPATMENLSMWIWNRLEAKLPGLFCVTVRRDSAGEACRYLGPQAVAA